jgi:pSer/pThr/pTyr-binding forkhead associated (FHA) protein
VGFSLKIIQGPEKGRVFKFDRIQITIGRTVDNDVVLPDPGISRQHLSIRDKGGAYIVKDLGSSNGTQLNGQKIVEEVLKPGDQIRAGGALILFEGPIAESKAARPASPGRGKREEKPAGRERPAVADRRPREAAQPAGQAKVRVGRGAAATGGRPAPAEAAGKPLVRSAGMRQRAAEAAPAAEPEQAAEPATGRGRGAGPGRKGKAGPLGKLKDRFLGLPKKTRMLLLACLGLLVILGLVAGMRGGQKLVQAASWFDEEVFSPADWAAEEAAPYFGLGPGIDYRCLYSANFQFKYGSGRATMIYFVSNIGSKDEVIIRLNGVDIGNAPVTLDGISDAITFNLPRKHLQENQINNLQFIHRINRTNPDEQKAWGVSVYSIEEQPLPQPDKRRAQEAFENAKETLKNKDVSPSNLYRAMAKFQEARDYLELFPENSRPDFYHEAVEDIRKAEEELNKRFRDLMFKAQQLEEFGKLKDAREAYRQLMLTFPNQDDWRHQEAKNAYAQFE